MPTVTSSSALEIVQRPLFFSSRRPLPPEPPAAIATKAEPPPKLDFALAGIVRAGASKIALIQPEKAKPILAGPGDRIGRWTVTEIEADRIMVRSGATVQLVGLQERSQHKPTGLPPEMRPGSAPHTPVAHPPVAHGPVRR